MRVGMGFDVQEPNRPDLMARVLVGVLFGVMIVSAAVAILIGSQGSEEPIVVDETEAVGVEDPSGPAAVDGETDDVWRTRVRDQSRPGGGDSSYPPLERTPRPGAERAFYERISEVAVRGPEAFHAAVQAALSATQPVAESVAALRVSYDLDVVDDYEMFHAALTRSDVRPRVRDFALRFVGEKSQMDPNARRALSRYLRTRPQPARCRGDAYFAVLRWGKGDEIRSLVPLMFEEKDAGVLHRAAKALAGNEVTVTVAAEILESLRYRHPVAEVRLAVAAVCAG